MPPTDSVIAVTGATGYVGRFVVDELQRRGRHVRALARPHADRGGFADPVTWVDGDLRSAPALDALVGGGDAVVHMAYEHVPGRYRGGEGGDLDQWLESNLMGSLRLLRLAAQANVSRFVFLSSRAVFSQTEPGRVLDESHPVLPDSHYGAYKAAVEAFLHSFQCQQHMQTFAVRATGVYGVTRPIERSKWWDLIVRTLQGETQFAQRGGTEVYGGDVARVVCELISRPHVESDVFHLSDLYVTNHDIVRIARRVAGLGDLPAGEAPSQASNPLECMKLRKLRIRLGGIRALEATVESLVMSARQSLGRDG